MSVTQKREAWVRALRSGKYEKQTDGYLRCGDAFCCLGVLCDLENPDGWKATDLPPLSGDYAQTYDFVIGDPSFPGNRQNGLPPWMIADAVQLNTPNGRFDSTDLKTRFPELYERTCEESGVALALRSTWALSELNDSDVTFGTIADVIEASPRGLFRDEDAI